MPHDLSGLGQFFWREPGLPDDVQFGQQGITNPFRVHNEDAGPARPASDFAVPRPVEGPPDVADFAEPEQPSFERIVAGAQGFDLSGIQVTNTALIGMIGLTVIALVLIK